MQGKWSMASLGRVGHVAMRLGVAGALAFAASPAGAEELWEGALRQQLLKQRDCQMQKITSFRELKVGELTVLEGRARCLDNREFEFTREQPHLPFKLHLCEPIYC